MFTDMYKSFFIWNSLSYNTKLNIYKYVKNHSKSKTNTQFMFLRENVVTEK